GLGLMNDRSSVDVIQAIVKGAVRRPDLLREASIALGLLGDKSIVPSLIDILRDRERATLAVQAAVATALGYVGDYRTIDPLVALLRDEKHELTAESRAFAAAALGIVGDKEDFTWNAKIAADINYVATTQTLNDHANATGILNLL
ncbi:MAG TPA: HEAT repeat domain-containing protein, partial [Planctomycetota bacterium]|nr:HEAT repeat domain-containing protein [Planctomycetota bacterium]